MEYWRRSSHQWIIVLVALLAAVSLGDAAQPTKVRMSYSSRSNSNTPFVIAYRKGFFAEEGMDVEMIQVNPRLGATAFEPTPERSTVGFSAAHNREPKLALVEVDRAIDVLDG